MIQAPGSHLLHPGQGISSLNVYRLRPKLVFERINYRLGPIGYRPISLVGRGYQSSGSAKLKFITIMIFSPMYGKCVMEPKIIIIREAALSTPTTQRFVEIMPKAIWHGGRTKIRAIRDSRIKGS